MGPGRAGAARSSDRPTCAGPSSVDCDAEPSPGKCFGGGEHLRRGRRRPRPRAYAATSAGSSENARVPDRRVVRQADVDDRRRARRSCRAAAEWPPACSASVGRRRTSGRSAAAVAGGRSGKALNSPPSCARHHPRRHVPSWSAITPASPASARELLAGRCSCGARSPGRRGRARRNWRKIGAVEVLALEAEQEQLRHLALERQPPRQVRRRCAGRPGGRAPRASGGGGITRARNDVRALRPAPAPPASGDGRVAVVAVARHQRRRRARPSRDERQAPRTSRRVLCMRPVRKGRTLTCRGHVERSLHRRRS